MAHMPYVIMMIISRKKEKFRPAEIISAIYALISVACASYAARMREAQRDDPPQASSSGGSTASTKAELQAAC